MGKQEILDYVRKTPRNTNENVLRSLLNNFEEEIKGGDGGDSHKEYLKTMGVSNNIIKSNFPSSGFYKKLIIPAYYGGYIESGTFSSSPNLTYLEFEDMGTRLDSSGMYTIGNNAFAGSTNLKEVHLGGVNLRINQGAFTGCTGLEIIDGIGATTFYEQSFAGTSLKTINIPAHCDLYSKCFNGSKLETVYLSKNINSLDGDVFLGCTSLTDIYCGFSEGKFEGAPWGDGVTATIHYDVPELQ